MVNFKIVIADQTTGKNYQKELTGMKADSLVGRRIGEEIEGALVELPGFRLKITGGTDKDGFPMRSDLPGGVRKAILASEGFGFHPEKKGMRKKKIFRGNMITPEIVQINLIITQPGPKSIEDAIKEGTA